MAQNKNDDFAALTIGTSFIACLFIGSLIGYYMDEYFGTNPLWFVIMLFVGLGAGFRNMIKIIIAIGQE